MTPVSLFQQGNYSSAWVKDFYTQAGKWWGADAGVPGLDQASVQIVERLCGPEAKRILELGAGAGDTAAALADRGHNVTAVELSPVYARHAHQLAAVPHQGTLTVLEADFYTINLDRCFDAVCYWDGFGVGSDADHRRLLRRIAHEWLIPGGSALLDIFSPIKPARTAGTEERLDPLEGVPESVEMLRRCHFDPVQCRWIDEWRPTAHPDQALAQTARCYTPVDFQLLLENTGLVLKRIEVEGEALDLAANTITTAGPLMDAWSYLVQLVHAD